MKNKILIGGATGATGSVAAKLLLEKGYDVLPWSTAKTNVPKNFRH
jgi:GDP-D-mannose dehydratase